MKNFKDSLLILMVIGLITLITGCGDNVSFKEYEPENIEPTESNGKLEEAQESQKDESGENISKEETVEIKERKKMELSPDQQREVNIFLSNFTEVFLQDFDSEPANEMLIHFGVMHNNWNNFNSINIKGDYGYLNKSTVSRSVDRFFGLEVKHQKTEQYGFDGSNYAIRMASGGMLPFAVVYELYDNEDGTLEAFFYEAFYWGEYFELDLYATLPKELNENVDMEIIRKKRAIVTRHDFEGKNPYKLLSYTTVE